MAELEVNRLVLCLFGGGGPNNPEGSNGCAYCRGGGAANGCWWWRRSLSLFVFLTLFFAIFEEGGGGDDKVKFMRVRCCVWWQHNNRIDYVSSTWECHKLQQVVGASSANRFHFHWLLQDQVFSNCTWLFQQRNTYIFHFCLVLASFCLVMAFELCINWHSNAPKKDTLFPWDRGAKKCTRKRYQRAKKGPFTLSDELHGR